MKRGGQHWIPSIFNDFFNSDILVRNSSTAPAINVFETEKEYKVEVAAADKAIELDRTTLTEIAAYRSGNHKDDERNLIGEKADQVASQINIAVENYPDLKAHQEIADVMQQNAYLQKEITAAREVYNATVNQWNSDLYSWPTKQIVAAKRGYTTRIPFTTSKEIKEKARDVFF